MSSGRQGSTYYHGGFMFEASKGALVEMKCIQKGILFYLLGSTVVGGVAVASHVLDIDNTSRL